MKNVKIPEVNVASVNKTVQQPPSPVSIQITLAQPPKIVTIPPPDDVDFYDRFSSPEFYEVRILIKLKSKVLVNSRFLEYAKVILKYGVLCNVQ